MSERFTAELTLPRWKCRECGCLWRDNLDGTVSLFDAQQKSCENCEMLPTAAVCIVEWFKSHAEPMQSRQAAASEARIAELEQQVTTLTAALQRVNDVYQGSQPQLPGGQQTGPQRYQMTISTRQELGRILRDAARKKLTIAEQTKLDAAALAETYRHEPWFVNVGIYSGSSLVLYVTKNAPNDLPANWKGSPLEIKRAGKPRPATTGHETQEGK
jgi:hypothetical protein